MARNISNRTRDYTHDPTFSKYVLALSEQKGSSKIVDRTPKEQEFAVALLVRLIVDENLPFAICDNREGRKPRLLSLLLKYLRPGFKMLLGHKIRGQLPGDYYEDTLKHVKAEMQKTLRVSRATIMCDGATDVNGAPMINVPVRLTGKRRVDTKTFFLTSLYTGYDTCTAKYYVAAIEKFMEEFNIGHGLAAVVTDNTSCVRNSREFIMRKHGRVVSSQDQAHVADKLFEDFGEIPWIKGVLSTVSAIGSDLRRYRKLRAKLIELMKVHKSMLDGPRRGTNRDTETQQQKGSISHRSSSGSAPDEFQFVDNGAVAEQFLDFINPRSEERGPETDLEEAEPTVDVCDSGDNIPELTRPPSGFSGAIPRGARLMKKVSIVRFASSEKLVDEYISLRPVLIKLEQDPLFSVLYKAGNAEERQQRQNRFIAPIMNGDLLMMVSQLHKIFHACRSYLRVFDAEAVWSSEIFEATRIIEETIDRLPLQAFPKPRRSNHQLLKNVFKNRMEGPFLNYKRIQVALLSDLHVAAALLDPYRSPNDDHPDFSDYMGPH